MSDDDRPRLVRVEFIREGMHMVEHYLCPDPATLVAFFEWVDEPPLPRFGGQATMTIHYIQTFVPAVKPAKAEVQTRRTPTKRAAKKQPARKRA